MKLFTFIIALLSSLGVVLMIFDAGANFGFKNAITVPGLREKDGWKFRYGVGKLIGTAYWTTLVNRNQKDHAWRLCLVGVGVRLLITIALFAAWWWL